jgi:hypothetical protein
VAVGSFLQTSVSSWGGVGVRRKNAVTCEAQAKAFVKGEKGRPRSSGPFYSLTAPTR